MNYGIRVNSLTRMLESVVNYVGEKNYFGKYKAKIKNERKRLNYH